MIKVAIVISCSVFLTACGAPRITPSPGHIGEPPHTTGNIPEPVRQSATIRPPKATPKVETYSVTVHKVPAQSLLFALARDAKLNVDIHPGITGEVTLNALDQTLPQLLTRISKQVDMRYELDGPNLAVLPDAPFLRNYKIDYVNVTRDATSKVSIATQIATTGGAGAAGGAGDNNSTTSVSNTSNNRFWPTLVKNIEDMLRETDKIQPDNQLESTAPAGKLGAVNLLLANTATSAAAADAAPRRTIFREAASVISNPETGLIAVRATGRQHEKIQEFLDMVMSSAKRQVLIEATVVEVQLNNNYQQGINWGSLSTNANAELKVVNATVGTNTLPSGIKPGISPGIFTLNYTNPTSIIGNIAATIQLLESFGKVKVLSSPKISVLNNQTALLKVVDNRVFFTIKVTPATIQDGIIITPATFESNLQTVPVGFVMSVTPQIADSDEVIINVRPSISRVIGFVQDPNPALAQASVVNNVPVIQTREMESVLKVSSGQIAVMGGLMQDTVNNLKDGIPAVDRIPLIGDALSYRNETGTKSELVIFMRPIVVKNASVDGDYQDYRYLLPDGVPLNRQPYTESNNPGSAPVSRAAGS